MKQPKMSDLVMDRKGTKRMRADAAELGRLRTRHDENVAKIESAPV